MTRFVKFSRKRSVRPLLSAVFAVCLVLSTVSGPVGASLASSETAQIDGSQNDSIREPGGLTSSASVTWPTLDSGDWPTSGRDPGRSGYNPNASGPKADADARWISEFSDDVADLPVVAADGLVFVPGETSLRAVDNETGDVVWNVSGVDIESVSVSDGLVITTEVDYSGDEIRAYRTSDGVELWNVTNFEADATVVLDGTLYASRGEYLYAFDVQTGTQQWSTDINEDVSLGLSGAGETVYATGRLSESNDRDYLVYALNASNGNERWRFEMEGKITMEPVVANDSVYIGSGSSARNFNPDDFDPKLYRLNATDGHVEWVFDVNSRPRGVAVASGTVYVASGHTVSAHDEATGGRAWRYRLPGSIDYGLAYTEMRALSPVVADGVVYATSERGTLVALDAADGSGQWTYRLEGLATDPAIADDRIYVLGFDDTDSSGDVARVYALEESPFKFTGFGPSTTTLTPGEQFTVDVTVENVDDEVRPYNLSLMADPPLPVEWLSLDHANGTLSPGESRTLTFTGSLNTSGTWNLSVKRLLGRDAAIGPTPVDVVHATTSDEWSQTEYDGGRTKFNPDTAGPTQHIQEVWNLTGFDRNNEPVIANGSVYVLLEGPESPSVYTLAAYDESTGTEEWAFNISAHDRIPAGSPTVHNGTVYLFTGPYNFDGDGSTVVDNSLFALDASDGSPVWSRDFTLNESVSRDQAPVVADGQVYVAGGIPEDNSFDANASLFAFDADTGVTSWSYSVSEDGENEVFEWVSASDGMVVASLSDEDIDTTTTTDDRVIVLNAAGGHEWSSSGLTPDMSDPPVVRDGVVYVVNETKNDAGDGAETLFALNLSDGTQEWEFVPYDLDPVVDDWRMYSPVVTDDGVYARQMMMDTSPRRNELYRLDPATGFIVWNRSVPTLLDFVVVDGLVYAGDSVGGYNDGDDTFIYDTETGDFYGETTINSRAHGSVKAVANGTMVFYTDSTTPNDFRVIREGGVIEYTDIAVDSHVVGEDENVTVTVNATNVGSYARAYNVNLWASPDDSGAHHFWNYADRDGTLAPGESTTISWKVRLQRRGDFVFTLIPVDDGDSLNRYMYDDAGSVTVHVGDERDGQRLDLSGPRDVSPSADSWPKTGFDAGNTGNNTGTAAPTAVESNPTTWTVNHSSEWTTGPTLANGTVFVGGVPDSGGDAVFAYNATDGTVRWTYQTTREIEVAPVYAGGYLYTADSRGRVYQFDAATGERLWTFSPGGDVGGLTVVDGVAYVAGSDYRSSSSAYVGVVYALDATTREVLWTFENTSGTSGMEVTPAVADGRVYVTNDDDATYALDASTGTELWSRPIAGSSLHSPVVAKGVVYVDNASYSSTNANVFALDATDGSTLWQTPANVDGDMGASPALANDTLYFVAGGAVRALNATDGSDRWSQSVCTAADYSPSYAGGVVYVPTTDNAIRAYDGTTGDLVWSFAASDYQSFSSAVGGGILYTTGLENGDADYPLYALEGGTANQSASPIQFSGLAVSNANVSTGESFTVSATAENNGDVSCAYSADLSVDETVVDTTTGTVDSGYYDTETVAFTHSLSTTGTYNVTIEDLPPVEVNVTAPAADPVASPTTRDFGDVDLGNSTDRYVKVSNEGTDTLTVSDWTLSGANTGDYVLLSSPPASVSPGNAEYIWIRFQPSASGTRTATLDVDTNEGPVSATLTGDGIGPAEVDVSPTAHDFGSVDVGNSSTTNVTVSNLGDAPLSLDSSTVTGTGAAAYLVTGGSGGATIAGGTSHNVTIEFAPSVTGDADATLELSTNDSDESTVAVALSGNGTITEPNQQPVPSADQYVVVEGETLSVDAPGVLENDQDPDNDSISATHHGTPDNGSLTFVSDGSFTYTPDSGFTGTDSFVYRIQDSEGTYSSYVTVTVEVLPDPNRKPEAVGDSYAVHAGEWLNVSAPGRLANDRDPDGDDFSASHHGDPSHGTLKWSSQDGSFNYTPDSGFTGTDSYVYRVQDEHGEYSEFTTVTIEVLPARNREPTAVDDTYTVSQGEWLNVSAPGRLANDYDVDGDSFGASHHGTPDHGTLVRSSQDGSLNYTPDSGFTGTDSYVYRVQDEHGAYSEFATVTIEVVPDNREPTVVEDHYATLADEWLNVSAPGRLSNDYDLDGDSFGASHHGDTTNGTLDQSSQDGSFEYLPDSGFTGTDSYVYRVRDDQGEYSEFGTVTIDVVDPTRTDPVAVPDHYTVSEGQWLNVSGPGTLANDLDPNGDSFTAPYHGSPSNGTLHRFYGSGGFQYKPADGFTGTDSFVYRVEDDTGAFSSYTTVTIEVLPDPNTTANRVPTVVDDTYTVYEGQWLNVSGPGRLANDYDVDGDTFGASHHGSPDHGTLERSAQDGSLRYLPDSGFTGTDSYVYRVRDEHGEYSTFGTVTIEVVPDPNRRPDAVDDHYSVYAGEWLNVSAPGRLANDRDPDGDDFSASHHGSPSHGTLEWSSQDGSLNYKPDSGFTGTDSYVYRVQDEHGEYSTFATVTIDVLPNPNRAPTAVSDSYVVRQGETLSVPAPGRLSNDYDADNDSFSASHHGTPDNGTLQWSSQDGSLTYTPDPGFTGVDSYVYRIQDEHGEYSSFAQVSITVVDASSSGLADISVAQDNVDFGTIPAGTNTTATVTVANIGDQNLTFTGATIVGQSGTLSDGSTSDGMTDETMTIGVVTDSGSTTLPFEVVDGTETVVLGYGATHTVTVEYEPSSTMSANATLVLQSDDPDEPSVFVPLVGDSYDDTPPTVDVAAITGSYRNGTTVYTNETVDVEVNVTDTFGSVDDVRVTLDSQATQYQVTDDATFNTTSGNWTASFAASNVHDDGRYDVVVSADDTRGNDARITANDTVVVDRTSPGLAATISRVNATAANVTLVATEDVRPGSAAVDLERPDGTVVSVTMHDEGGHWNGTFSLPTDGQYNVTATAIDFAGNRGTDTASSLLVTRSTDGNNTITAQIQPSGLFVRFTTDQPVNDTFVTMTERNVSAEPLVRGQTGVSFLDAALGSHLDDNLSYAVIGIPVNQSLRSGTGVDDVTIRYYNESSDEWEDVSTTVQNVTLNGTTDRYWVANVSHFSTYGAVAVDTTAPSVTSTTPGDGTQLDSATSSKTLRVEYEDALSGIDASRTAVLFDGTLVTAADATTITSDYVEYEATGLADGSSHTFEVTVEDEAGNTHTETVSFTVDEASSGGTTAPSNDDGDTSSDDSSSTDGTSSSTGGSDSPLPDESSDEPQERFPSVDVTSLDDGSFVVHLRNESAGDSLSTSVDAGSFGMTGVAVEHITVSASEAGNRTLTVTGGTAPSGHPLSSESGNSIAYLTMDGSEPVVATLRFTVSRAVLDDRDAGPSDVVVYSRPEDGWVTLDLRRVRTTDDGVVYEVEGADLTSVVVATRPSRQTTSPTATATTDETPTQTTSPRSTTSSEMPGFGLGTTAFALVALLVLLRRRRSALGRSDEE